MNTKQVIQGLEVLCLAAMSISGETQGRPMLWQTSMASLAFSRIALNSVSILRTTPESRFCSPVSVPELGPGVHAFQVWDLPSVASLSRNLVEAYLTLHYMAQPNCSAAELVLREKVWRYHETCERLQMLRSALPESPDLAALQTDVRAQRTAIMQDAWFKNLGQTLRWKIVDAKVARLQTNEELCSSAGIDPGCYSSVFKYGSNHTHSSPFSYAQMDAFSAGDENALKAFQLALETSAGFTALAIRDYTRLFPDQAPPAGSKEKELLELWENILKSDVRVSVSPAAGSS